jgi:hypothetical protein
VSHGPRQCEVPCLEADIQEVNLILYLEYVEGKPSLQFCAKTVLCQLHQADVSLADLTCWMLWWSPMQRGHSQDLKPSM